MLALYHDHGTLFTSGTTWSLSCKARYDAVEQKSDGTVCILPSSQIHVIFQDPYASNRLASGYRRQLCAPRQPRTLVVAQPLHI